MVQGTLVENQIDDGMKLAVQLIADEFDVSALFWMKPSEDGSWTLCIASKSYDEKGPTAAYQAVYDALQKLSDPWISWSEIKVIGATNPITKDVLEAQRRHPGKTPTHFRISRLGNIEVDDVYIYTAPINFHLEKYSKVQENLQKFFDQGWVLDGMWSDGYPRVRQGKQEHGFVYYIRVDEGMTPEKVPFLEGERPKTGSGTIK